MGPFRLLCGPRWHQVGPKMALRGFAKPQDGSELAPEASRSPRWPRRWPQDGPNWPRDELKTTPLPHEKRLQDGSMILQMAPRWLEDWSNRLCDGVRMGQEVPKNHQLSHGKSSLLRLMPFSGPFRPLCGPRWRQVGPKMASTSFARPEDASKWAPEAS